MKIEAPDLHIEEPSLRRGPDPDSKPRGPTLSIRV
jgi:hypothetical protein